MKNAPYIKCCRGGSPKIISLVFRKNYPNSNNIENQIINVNGTTLSLMFNKATKELCTIVVIKEV